MKIKLVHICWKAKTIFNIVAFPRRVRGLPQGGSITPKNHIIPLTTVKVNILRPNAKLKRCSQTEKFSVPFNSNCESIQPAIEHIHLSLGLLGDLYLQSATDPPETAASTHTWECMDHWRWQISPDLPSGHHHHHQTQGQGAGERVGVLKERDRR